MKKNGQTIMGIGKAVLLETGGRKRKSVGMPMSAFKVRKYILVGTFG
jgi:hypothetical protein